ncbi:MAG: hypothetical protein QXU98_13335 [Candidatus Parvarchaeota archaeon]
MTGLLTFHQHFLQTGMSDRSFIMIPITPTRYIVTDSNSGVVFASNLSGVVPMGMPEYKTNLSVNCCETANHNLANNYWI